jgi:hypothetical protein
VGTKSGEDTRSEGQKPPGVRFLATCLFPLVKSMADENFHPRIER